MVAFCRRPLAVWTTVPSTSVSRLLVSTRRVSFQCISVVARQCHAILLLLLVLTPFLASASTEDGRSENNAEDIREDGVELIGRSRSQRPLFVNDADACHAACEEQTDCLGWMFRAASLRCLLFNEDLTFHECPLSDCRIGIVVRRLSDADQAMAFRETIQKMKEQQFERFRGRSLTCKERRTYLRTSQVLFACHQLQQRCGAAEEDFERRPLPPVSCGRDEMLENTNIDEGDVNSGLDERTLTPEDCCLKCMETRRCVAWSRTATGQCWLKGSVKETQNTTDFIGDVSGPRVNIAAHRAVVGTGVGPRQAKCGRRVSGLAYKMEDKDGMNETSTQNTDACCRRCTEEHLCTGWSYFPSNQTCRRFYGYQGLDPVWEETEATTAFMLAVPEKCDGQSSTNDPTDIDLAAAHHPPCSALLYYGPAQPTSKCRGIEEAKAIFAQTIDRIRQII